MKTRSWLSRANYILGSSITLGLAFTLPSFSQVIPDNTLGRESSVLTPSIPSQGDFLDRIDGGAIRNNNLFHSFSELNVEVGQRLYFANPADIDNIISRVTGDSASNVFGTLGVLGNANLFLINPNGIVFGPDAELDVRGSFVASTADRLVFESGYAFTTTNPDLPPLLALNAPLGLGSWLPSQGAIASSANLSAGQDLNLSAETISLQGQISAGGELNLLATNQLIATDSATAALILSAGKALTLQGNQGLEIDALAHPRSGVTAGGSMALRSQSPILGDATFTAGGNVSIQGLDGQLGTLISPKDPVFEVGGDFELADFAGGSLQILAGGSVTIPGEIFIDTAGGPFNDSVVILSNGIPLALNGTTQPTLDIRAGTTGFFGSPEVGNPTSANIVIGSIFMPGGQVFLTNQYQPNPTLLGDITIGSIETLDFAGGGDVVVDSRGGITFGLIDVSGQNLDFETGGNAGDITMIATGELFMPFGTNIFSYGLQGGNITFASNTAIVQEDAPFFGFPSEDLSFIESVTLGSGKGGDIRFSAPLISLGGNVVTTADGNGIGGDIILTTDQLITSQASILARTFGSGDTGDVRVQAGEMTLDFSLLGTLTLSNSGGNAGSLDISAGSIVATTGAQMVSVTAGVGNAGNVTVDAQSITLSGFQPGDQSNDVFAPSTIASSVEPIGEGNGGIVLINTGTLTILDGANVGTSTFGIGNGGRVAIAASESITIDGAVYVNFETFQDSQPSGISSEVFTNAVGDGGEIVLSTPVLRVTNGGTITSLSDGDGNAGNISITATESVLFDGVASFAEVGQPNRISGATVETLAASTGNGGILTITVPQLTLANGARLGASTSGAGTAGNIVLNVENDLGLSDDGTGIFANTTPGSTGDGGSIIIDPQRIAILDGAQISVASAGSGQAGNIVLEGGSLILDRGLITAETLSSAGGNITLRINDVIVLLNNSLISTTAGTALAGGDGGNIDITTTYLVAQPNGNSDITANAFSGAGGSVLITAQGIFGLTPRSRAELEALLGTSDPALLDPGRLSTSDITAISRGNPDLQGQVIIQSPDVDPSQGTVPLPDNVVDASRLIAQGCSSGGAVAQEIGSLVVTGRGGLPPSPTDSLGSSQVLVDWATGSGGDAPPATTARSSSPTQLVEVQSLVAGADGQVVLVAQASPPQLPALTCAGTPGGN